MVASDATCEAIDIRFPEATMTMIGWPRPQVSTALLACVNDVMTFLSVNDVVTLINYTLLTIGADLWSRAKPCRSLQVTQHTNCLLML